MDGESRAEDLMPVRGRGNTPTLYAFVHTQTQYGRTRTPLTVAPCGACGKGWWCERDFFLKLFKVILD